MKNLFVLALIAGLGYQGYLHFISSHRDGAFDADGNPKVVLFVHDACGTPCKSATYLLKRRHVDFESVNVDDGAEQVERWKSMGAVNRMPYIVAGSEQVAGYNKWDIILALAENYDDTYLTASEARMLNKNFTEDGQPKLVMYTMDGCGYCDMARSFLLSEGIPFEERNTSLDSVAKVELDRVGVGTPLIFYGYKHYVGWGKHVRAEVLKLVGA